ncbi:heme o synthase [Virgibacillus sp. W0181]|uniref:heme o synthase n=1 Tax=Virgibacillus sp. W0181 TaxID=3391581 RepID=UPI003F452133
MTIGVNNVSKISSTPGRIYSESSLLADIKSLLKGLVLVANVLPVLTGFWLATHFAGVSFVDHFNTFILTIIGSTLTVAGALMLNNWYEVDLDREMLRTKQRPTVTGHFSLQAVLFTGVASSTIGIVLLMLTTMEAALYAFLGWFTYVVLYTFWSKRRFTLNTVIGSVSGAFTPLIGWAAIEPAYHIVPISLFLILFFWQIPHTFAIAIRRYKEYKAAGVPMLPVVAGIEMTKRQAVIYITCLLPLPLLLSSLGTIFIIIASILNVVWIVIGVRGFFLKDDIKWANMNFYYSLIYLVVLLFTMMVVTYPGAS